MSSVKRLSRRELLRGMALAAGAAVLTGCAPKVVEKIVKETVIVETEKEKVVKETVVQEKVVKETVQVQVEKQVTVVKDWPLVRWSFIAALSDPLWREILKMQSDFTAANHIRVEFEQGVGTWDEFAQKLVASYAAGTSPDVFNLFGPLVRLCIDKGILLSLNPLVDKEPKSFMADFGQGQLPVVQKGSTLYGVPKYTGVWAYLYNKDLFDQAGLPQPTKDWTYQDFLTAAQKITKRDKDGKLQQAGAELGFSLAFDMAPTIWSWGGEIADADRRKCLLDQPQAVESLKWQADLRWKHKVLPAASEVAALSTGGGWGTFPSGKCGMYPCGSWWFCCNLDAVADKFRYGVLPQFKGPGGKRETMAASEYWLVNSKTKNPAATWEWVKLLAGPTWQRPQLKYLGLQPSIKSLMPEWTQTIKENAVKASAKQADLDLSPFVDGLDYGRAMFFFDNNTAVMDILQPVLDQIFITGTATVDQAIPEVVKKINAM